VLSRPKGWGKSPLLAALCLVEALADVVLDGWDANGEPVGRPWTSLGFKAKVQITAVSEDQTANTWEPLLDMARNGPVLDAYGIDPMETFIVVPRGRIEVATSAGSSREGFRPVMYVLDQTESWTVTNGGVKLAAALRRNLAKVQGLSVETPNGFIPGELSVAERSYEAWQAQVQGRLRNSDSGIHYDHREMPPDTDIEDRASLLAGLAYAYGDSADVNGGWVSMPRILADFWDPDTDPQDGRRYYGNQITHAGDSWVSQPEWAACSDPTKVIADGDTITLGFDGSRSRARGVTDATALIGCRLADGHLFELGVWEQPAGPAGEGWRPPISEVLAAVDRAFARYRVIGFFADPAKWESYVTAWEGRYGAGLKVKATRDHPIEWWMTGGRSQQIVKATDRLHSAITSKQLTHGGEFALTRHILNARRRASRSGVQISKEHPESVRKIDAASAAILAYEARSAAVAAGISQQPKAHIGVTY
jgi:hypothetical protein